MSNRIGGASCGAPVGGNVFGSGRVPRASIRRAHGLIRRCAAVPAAVAAALPIGARAALAHGHGAATGEDPWLLWPFAPEVLVGLLLAAAIYAVGLRRSRAAQGVWRGAPFAFFGGLAALFVALHSPVEPIADHVFIVHQVEHMLLRTVAPMLLMLAAPQAVLTRGLPHWARRGLVAPVMGSGGVHAVFGVIAHPAVATALFLGTSYFWMVPRWHDIAILDEPVHYGWHVSLLVSGLIFFWRVFDPRRPPLGASLPTRLVMFWFALIGNIALGLYLSFKTEVLYDAYGVMGRFWGLDALTDERFGGLTMWIPGCMMFVMAALAVVHRWSREEGRVEARLERGRAAVTADEMRLRQRPRNRAMAVGLVGFVAMVFGLAVSAAVIFERANGHY